MKAVVLMFDSLNTRYLPPYGCDWVHAPNFRRLAERTVRFDNSYVCSMPCMPARRDFHTGRPGFLHRGWGPMEPFDDSLPKILKDAGVYTHLITDHYHYFEEGGANYHTKYSTWENFRGQEGDPWIGQVADPEIPDTPAPRGESPNWRQDWVNRPHLRETQNLPISRTFSAGCDFLRRNHDQDRWMLHLETFDPHEPFFSHRSYKDFYAEHYRNYRGQLFDWPPYREVRETPEEVEHVRYEYASLVSLCDEKLGDVLDLFDELDLWKDTMLVVWTDHGFLLGEHDCWAKCWMPFYDEVARTPFFVWDPRSRKTAESRQALVQPALDLAPTLLRFFDLPPTSDMTGHDLADTVANDTSVRDYALFGMHGFHVNLTDGRHVYMRGLPDIDHPGALFTHTLVPSGMREAFPVERFQPELETSGPYSFTKGCKLLKIPIESGLPGKENVKTDLSSKLFDLETDPGQEHPLQNPELEEKLCLELVRLMTDLEAPPDLFKRLGLNPRT